MEELYLNDNKIKDFGTKSIATGLKENSTLKILELSKCNICGDEGQTLSEAFKINQALEKINF